MTKRLAWLWIACLIPLALQAEDDVEEGFLTSYLNRGLKKATQANEPSTSRDTLQYGKKVSSYMSTPVFGGYINAKYAYSSQSGAHGGEGFTARLVRMYVSGTVLRDFKYRIQMELKGTPAMRDYTIEWARWKEFSIKAGQFKRTFTFENPMSPWDIGFGGYSQLSMKLSSFGDYCGEPSVNGRDQGIQFQGDLLPVGKDRQRLFHYQAAVFNGNGINRADNNHKKDWMGTFQLQPVEGLYIGLFGWKGTYTADGVTVGRNRWALGVKYESEPLSARAEYAHNTGHRIADYDTEACTWSGTGRADAWYAQAGVRMTPWLKTFVRYDAYRSQATWGTLKTIYSVCPNIQLHKNLLFQLQYNYVHDRTLSRKDYHEFWAESFIRF